MSAWNVTFGFYGRNQVNDYLKRNEVLLASWSGAKRGMGLVLSCQARALRCTHPSLVDASFIITANELWGFIFRAAGL